MAKLTDLRCRSAASGTHSDGHGLLLQVKAGAGAINKSWVYRYTVNGKQTWMGLGSYPDVTLAAARGKATDARRLRADGIDPIAQKRAARTALQSATGQGHYLWECADRYIKAHQASWRSVRHAKQWVRSLDVYVLPAMGSLPVSVIDTALVMQVLKQADPAAHA